MPPTRAFALSALLILGSAFAMHIPTIQIAPGVNMPIVTMGGDGSWGESNYSMWLDLGGRGFDTAWEYQTSQDIRDAILASDIPRSEIFITHKIPGSLSFNCTNPKCQTFPELPPVTGHYTPQMARHYIVDNLRRLGAEIGYVDLLLLHTPCNYGGSNHNASECAAIYAVLEEAVRNGTARAIGVSNYGSSDLVDLLRTAKIKPTVNQCHAAVGTFDFETYQFCRQHNITYQAWSPLHSDCLHDPAVTDIAHAHNGSVYEVGLRWLVQNEVPFVTSSNSSSHMLSDASVFDFNLSATEMATLNSMKCGFGH